MQVFNVANTVPVCSLFGLRMTSQAEKDKSFVVFAPQKLRRFVCYSPNCSSIPTAKPDGLFYRFEFQLVCKMLYSFKRKSYPL